MISGTVSHSVADRKEKLHLIAVVLVRCVTMLIALLLVHNFTLLRRRSAGLTFKPFS
jgi:hypothetical protein